MMKRAKCVWLKRADLVLNLPPKSICVIHVLILAAYQCGQGVVLSQLPPRLKPCEPTRLKPYLNRRLRVTLMTEAGHVCIEVCLKRDTLVWLKRACA